MIINTLKINNYRVFAGEHLFDLNPRIKYGNKRPIILFGGLNGSGKTSILSAIQLALYGKQSLGNGISQKHYEDFLSNSIHRNNNDKTQAHNASIELSFTYAKLGEKFSYTVAREWMKSGQATKELITISENGKSLENLSYDQCQGFLNELIPIGLSNLFFFDGEKIAELAEDTKGEALGDAIKRLIGLDQFDVLDNDLGVLLRGKQAEQAPKEVSSQIKKLEKELKSLDSDIQSTLQEFESKTTAWTALGHDLDMLENDFKSKGGAWVNSYEKENRLKGELIGEKKTLENTVREQLASELPLALAQKFTKKVVSQLNKEKSVIGERLLNQFVLDNSDDLATNLETKKLSKSNSVKMVNSLKELLEPKKSKFKSIHEVSDRTHYRIIDTLTSARSELNKTVASVGTLKKLNARIDEVGKNLSRAPSQESVQKEFEKLSKLKDQKSKVQAERAVYAERYRKLLQSKLQLLRNLDKLTEGLFSNNTSERSTELAKKSRTLIKQFGSKMAESKVRDLESEFVRSFERLARKEDIKLSARIDPKTFSVEIVRDKNHLVGKNELSAGEKQIYAIAILEALARTSGRKLPIIIDTPLGRLDSKHRNKLIKNYFPNASHQVIILSTDTEVDESFYSELSKSISHAYRLDYDADTASTEAIEGYFWKNKPTFKEVV
jgi:DNA sulfur modification protein DndD